MGNVELHKEVLGYVTSLADEAVEYFAGGNEESVIKVANKDLEEKVELLKEFDVIVGRQGALEDLGIHYFTNLSVVAIRLYCSRLGLVSFKDKALELHDIYKRKNSDYGNSFGESLEKFGVIASVVRLQDKVSRFVSLTTGGNKQLVVDEKVEDTLLDLINYCVMTVMYYEELYASVKFEIEQGKSSGLVCKDVNYSVATLPEGVVDMWGVKVALVHPFGNYVKNGQKYYVKVPMYRGVEGTTVGYFGK